jgi:hypothetical protein
MRRAAPALLGVLACCLLVASCSALDPDGGAVTVGAPERSAADPRSAVAPADQIPGIAEGTACPGTHRPAGWLAAENARSGNRLRTPDGDLDDRSVVGYADRSSTGCGEMVSVQLSGRPGTVRLRAYRIGWYHGDGARLVWTSDDVRVRPQRMPSGAAPPHLVVPAWPVSVTLPVDGTWAPGVYLVVPYAHDDPAGPGIPLVVRNDEGREPILFKASTMTWSAYGTWGGWSLYHGPAGAPPVAAADRARMVALQRPLVDAGYDQMRFMDLPVVEQLERLGPDVGYVTDEDVDARPDVLQQHTEVVSGGHSEYWTRRMYDGLLAAVAHGVNLAFLGANNLWWQARLETSPGASRPDRMVVYRSLKEDPVAARDPQAATVLWGAAPLHRDPAAVLGASHAAIGVRGGLQLLDPPDWFVAGTGLMAGSALPGSVGNEADGYNRRGTNPAGTQVLAAGVLRGAHAPVVVSVDYVTLPSGAAVFTAGSTDWACVPSGRCLDLIPPADTADAVRELTRNVLLTLAAPAAGRTHPAVPVSPFVASDLLPRLTPAAIGTYGGTTQESDGD